MKEQRDLGLLILRGWYWTALHAGKSLSHAGLAPLIGEWFSNSSRARFVGYVQRIDRRVSDWVRLSDKSNGGKCRAGNGRSALHKRSTWRRLAQSGPLPHYLCHLELNRCRQIFGGPSLQTEKIPNHNGANGMRCEPHLYFMA